jgi:dUTPase
VGRLKSPLDFKKENELNILMILKVKKNHPDAKIPTRANPSDAGLDVYAFSMEIKGEKLNDYLWKSIDYIEYDCGISIQPSEESDVIQSGNSVWVQGSAKKFFTYLAPRSSISSKNLIQANSYGLIDAGYTGPLKIRYKYIPQAKDFIFFSADKWPHFGIEIDESRIYQSSYRIEDGKLVSSNLAEKIGQLIVTEQQPVFLNQVKELNTTDRGNGGFGSSGGK